jgi:hypothetical protein
MAISEQERNEAGLLQRRANEAGESALRLDERWLLVERILESHGFQRADQLRKILTYISRRVILQPHDSIREYEIACDVLGRRQDFDSGSDTIVRVQVSHLRRKLEVYFAAEGAKEPLRLTIPRGSYAASFVPAHLEALPAAIPQAAANDNHLEKPALEAEHTELADPIVVIEPKHGSMWSRRSWLWVAAACICTSMLTVALDFALRPRRSSAVQDLPPVPSTSPFLKPLVANHKPVSIILPDTSMMIIQTLLGQDLSAAAYVTGSTRQDIKDVKDAGLKEALGYIADRRTTSFNESAAAVNLNDRLSRAGAVVKVRYARDLHVNDMDGDIILLGSRRSNPWATLFTEKINFRLLPEPNSHEFSFVNAHPMPGEQARFVPDYQHYDRVVTYADIALVPNLNNDGLVLLISGSDVEGTEAAVRFMFEDNWPPQLQALFARKDLKSYEVFLRGTHITNEAPDHFDVVAVR